jgi:hypothetical protein
LAARAQKQILLRKRANSKTSMTKTKYFTTAELQALPTLSQGHTDDLKMETTARRVWLSRLTKADGQPYDNQITIEAKNEDGSWSIIRQYDPVHPL